MDGSAADFEFGRSEFSTGELGWAHAGEHAGDQDLAAALRRGEDAAYERLLAQFEHPVYNLVYRLLHRPPDAEDVTQDVFLKVFRSIGSFRGDSSLKTWVYRIAVNEARNHLRKSLRRGGHEVGLDDEASDGLTWEQLIEDQHSSPFEAAYSSELESAIEAALAQLRPVFREAVVLRDVEQLSYLEISAIVDENVSTVKTRILRGRRALRVLLEQNQTRLTAESPRRAAQIAQTAPCPAAFDGDSR